MKTVKLFFIGITICFALNCFSEEETQFKLTAEELKNLSAEFAIGNGPVWLNDEFFWNTSLQPTIIWRHFRAEFDIRLLFNKSGIRTIDWENLSRVANHVKSIRFSVEDVPLLINLGIIENKTYGSGLITQRYRSVPSGSFDKLLGREFSIDYTLIRIQDIGNDLFNQRMEGVNINLNLGEILGPSNNLRQRLGFTLMYDRNPNRDRPAISNLAYSTDELIAYSMDLELGIYNNNNKLNEFELTGYGEIAAINNHGSGFLAPGIRLKYKDSIFSVEFRRREANFEPNLFDSVYEERRPVNWESADLNPNQEAKTGFLLGFKQLTKLAVFSLYFQEYAHVLPDFYFEALLFPSLLNGLKGFVFNFYSKNNKLTELDDKKISTSASIIFTPLEKWEFSVGFRQSYDYALLFTRRFFGLQAVYSF